MVFKPALPLGRVKKLFSELSAGFILFSHDLADPLMLICEGRMRLKGRFVLFPQPGMGLIRVNPFHAFRKTINVASTLFDRRKAGRPRESDRAALYGGKKF